MTDPQVAAIAALFRTCRIPRFAFLVDAPPIMPMRNALELLRPVLLQELRELLDRLPRVPDQIVLQFEKSDRLLPKLMAALPHIEVSTLDEKPVPVILLVTPKSACSSTLEMADHVLHRAQRARKEFTDTVEPKAWFTDVFPPPPSGYSRYAQMRLGKIDGPGWQIECFEDRRVRVSFSPR